MIKKITDLLEFELLKKRHLESQVAILKNELEVCRVKLRSAENLNHILESLIKKMTTGT